MVVDGPEEVEEPAIEIDITARVADDEVIRKIIHRLIEPLSNERKEGIEIFLMKFKHLF